MTLGIYMRPSMQPTTRRHARPLFDCWRAVEARIRRAERVLLLLDFDGTLVGFKRNPEEVKLDAATRRLLANLARHPRVTLGFVSGRRRADLKRRIGVRNACYYGLHGWESHPGMRLDGASRKLLAAARGELAAKVEGEPGVWLEDKQASFVLHYRESPPRAALRAQAASRAVVRRFAPCIRSLSGKKIVELLPAGLPGKGEAVASVVNGRGRGALAIYAGDDTTDESAFAVLKRGITIRVGSYAKTQARYRVRDPRELILFLDRLADLLSRFPDSP
ncbi:MAG: trehalose-phosphatase [Terriglobia bacterium]